MKNTPFPTVSAALVLVGVACSVACTNPQRICSPKTNDALVELATSGKAIDCNIIAIRETDMVDLSGAEDILFAGKFDVEFNPKLSDFSAIQGLKAGSVVLRANLGAEVVSLGPVGGGSVGILGNSISELQIDLLDNTELNVAEPSLTSLTIGGGPEFDVGISAAAEDLRVDFGPTQSRRTWIAGLAWVSTAEKLQRFGVPKDSLEFYGVGIDPDDPIFPSHLTWLRERGFVGTMTACSNPCDWRSEEGFEAQECDGEWRANCVSYDAAEQP